LIGDDTPRRRGKLSLSDYQGFENSWVFPASSLEQLIIILLKKIQIAFFELKNLH
jgi:hypothetical protein